MAPLHGYDQRPSHSFPVVPRPFIQPSAAGRRLLGPSDCAPTRAPHQKKAAASRLLHTDGYFNNLDRRDRADGGGLPFGACPPENIGWLGAFAWRVWQKPSGSTANRRFHSGTDARRRHQVALSLHRPGAFPNSPTRGRHWPACSEAADKLRPLARRRDRLAFVGTYWPHPAGRLVMTVSHTCTPFVRGSNPLPPPLTEWSAGIGTMRRASPHEEDGGEGRPPPASDERDYGGSQSIEGRRSRRRLHLAEVPRKLERQYDTPTAFRCLPCAALSEC